MTLYEITVICVGFALCTLFFSVIAILFYGIVRWLLGGYEAKKEDCSGNEVKHNLDLDNSEYDWGHDVNYRQEDEE